MKKPIWGYQNKSGKWVKLESTAEGVHFKKDLMPVGTFLDPKDPTKKITMTPEIMDNLIGSFNRYNERVKGEGVHVPLRHTDDPEKNAGWLERLYREGDTLFGDILITEPDIAGRIERKSIKWVSISWAEDFLDEKGNKYKNFLAHVALTNIPQIRGQGGFIKLESGYEALRPDKVVCEVCGHEFEQPTEASESIACPQCSILLDYDGTMLMREDYNKEKYSDKDWGSVDKTALGPEAHLFVPDKEKKSTWKLPYRDDTGKINIGAVKAIWGAIQGSRGGVDIPADELASIKAKVDGWRKELQLGEHAQAEQEELMNELEKMKATVADLVTKVANLEAKAKAGKLTDAEKAEFETVKTDLQKAKDKLTELETADANKGKNTELENTVKTQSAQIKDLEKFKADAEKKELETTVDSLINSGKMPPAVKGKVLLLAQEKVKTIELEVKNGDKTEKKTVNYGQLLLEVFAEMPQYEGFVSKTNTGLKKPDEVQLTADKKKAREVVELITGTSKSKELEASVKK